MQAQLARAVALAFCIALTFTRAFSEELLTEQDFVFLAPQAPFKFIDLPEPYVSTASRIHFAAL
jgi:hypothetical protein